MVLFCFRERFPSDPAAATYCGVRYRRFIKAVGRAAQLHGVTLKERCLLGIVQTAMHIDQIIDWSRQVVVAVVKFDIVRFGGQEKPKH